MALKSSAAADWATVFRQFQEGVGKGVQAERTMTYEEYLQQKKGIQDLLTNLASRGMLVKGEEETPLEISEILSGIIQPATLPPKTAVVPREELGKMITITPEIAEAIGVPAGTRIRADLARTLAVGARQKQMQKWREDFEKLKKESATEEKIDRFFDTKATDILTKGEWGILFPDWELERPPSPGEVKDKLMEGLGYKKPIKIKKRQGELD